MSEAVEITTTENQPAPNLNEANQSLRKAVAERNERQATARFEPAHAALDASEIEEHYSELKNAIFSSQDSNQGNQKKLQLRPGSEGFLAVLEEVRAMHLRKTLDYGTTNDALANIRESAEVINAQPYAGAVLRMSDKMHRLRSFFHNGRVEFDGVEDTLLDLCAYSAIALVLYRESEG